MQQICLRFFLCAFLIGAVSSHAKPEKTVNPYKIIVKADRDNGLYKCGEKVTFAISLLKNNKSLAGQPLFYTLKHDGAGNKNGKITSASKPVMIETSLKTPGFVLCTVTYKPEGGKPMRAFAGAGYEPLKINIGAEAPSDFDTYWAAKTKILNGTPLQVTMTPVVVPKHLKGRVECFDIKVNCPGSTTPVSGYFARPVNAKKGSLPAIVQYHGAGVRSSYKPLGWAAKGMLALDVNAHGIENGKKREFYTDLAKTSLKGYPFFGSEDREKSYFQAMYLRLYRALQFIKSQPEWDGKTLISYGSSQGGGQSIVAAALDPQVSFCVARVAALCDHHGVNAKRQSGWPRFIQRSKHRTAMEKTQISKASGYVDAAHFASKIKCPVIFTAGFIDRTCCPASVYAAYNNVKGEKSIINNVTAGHTNPRETTTTLNNAMKAHIKASK